MVVGWRVHSPVAVLVGPGDRMRLPRTLREDLINSMSQA